MKFMLMMSGSQKGWETGIGTWPEEDIKEHIRFMIRFAGELKGSGELVSAEGLDMPNQAKEVRASKTGTPIVSDGPFPESKEFLAGYWIVDVETPKRAYELAARVSAAPGRGGAPMNMAVEVRQVMSGPPVEV